MEKSFFCLDKKVYSAFLDGIVLWHLTNGLQFDKGDNMKKPQYFVAWI